MKIRFWSTIQTTIDPKKLNTATLISKNIIIGSIYYFMDPKSKNRDRKLTKPFLGPEILQ
jgi:hypothetical protein